MTAIAAPAAPPPASEPAPTWLARRLLEWWQVHGRRDLPWHKRPDAYAIWVSEIMLQQTQVAAVIPYYERFVARFPTVEALAAADVDEVLHEWTGLGYYSRARNLHRAARTVCDEHGGRFPTRIAQVQELPGIGRSTAAAILAFAHGQPHAILDGNVRRVLARCYRVDGYPGEARVEKRLWRLAEHHTPQIRVAAYTQAVMDLGAMVCRRTRPLCPVCPLAGRCRARRGRAVARYPSPRPRRERPRRSVVMLMLRDEAGRVLLECRPQTGVWAGLWSFPELATDADPAEWSRRTLGLEIAPQAAWPVVRHGFTHYALDITPMPARVVGDAAAVMEDPARLWYNPRAPRDCGLPAPVKRLIEAMESDRWESP